MCPVTDEPEEDLEISEEEREEFRNDPRTRAEVDADTRALFVRSHESIVNFRAEVAADPGLTPAERTEKLAKCDSLVERSAAGIVRWDMMKAEFAAEREARRPESERLARRLEEMWAEPAKPVGSPWSRLGFLEKVLVVVHFLILGWAMGMFRDESRGRRG